MIGKTAIITSPGADARAEEVIATEQKVRELGLKVERISQPGTLDGGDVLVVGRRVLVGRSERTTQAGVDALAAYITMAMRA